MFVILLERSHDGGERKCDEEEFEYHMSRKLANDFFLENIFCGEECLDSGLTFVECSGGIRDSDGTLDVLQSFCFDEVDDFGGVSHAIERDMNL